MKPMKVVLMLVLMVWMTGLNGQNQRFMLKIVDLQNQTVLIENATSSSSSSCNTSDFPVYQEGTRTDVNLRELNRIVVHPETPTTNDEVYIAVELIDREGKSEMTEMIRNIRVMGDSEEGRYRKRIEEIRTVDVLF